MDSADNCVWMTKEVCNQKFAYQEEIHSMWNTSMVQDAIKYYISKKKSSRQPFSSPEITHEETPKAYRPHHSENIAAVLKYIKMGWDKKSIMTRTTLNISYLNSMWNCKEIQDALTQSHR